ncbi:MAG: exodeoxyribonuclease III [Pseudomonadota bacterium]
MFRIITLNANGIRAAARKGVYDWLAKQNADVVCIQETKAQVHQLEDPMFSPEGYHTVYVDAEKKGYSGVAIYSRHKPDKIVRGLGIEAIDNEGRYVEVQLPGVAVASVYLPSGTSGDERQAFKMDVLAQFHEHLKKLKRRRREYVICGDFNIAHTKEDIRNWRGNQKNSGFLPEEREWMDVLFNETKYVDSFRELEQEPHQYTWWSNRGQAWANNTGWRIDYQVTTPGLAGKVLATDIYRDERFSDHAPFTVDYDFTL